MLDVQLRRFRRMVRGVMKMALGGVRVVSCRLMIACFVVRCRLAVMTRCVFMVFGCEIMVLCRLLGHVSSLRFGAGLGTA